MPIILNAEQHENWLSEDTSAEDAAELLTSNHGAELVSYRVGWDVNSNRASGAELIDPFG